MVCQFQSSIDLSTGGILNIEYSATNQTTHHYYRTLQISIHLTSITPLRISNVVMVPYTQPIHHYIKSQSLEDLDISSAIQSDHSQNSAFTFKCDITNIWNKVMRVKFYTKSEEPIIDILIHPLCSKHLSFTVDRIHVDKETLARGIPASNDKQFIVGKNISGDTKKSQELFWVKRALFGDVGVKGNVRAEWELSDTRFGSVCLRSLELNDLSLECVKMLDVSVECCVKDLEGVICDDVLAIGDVYSLECIVMNMHGILKSLIIYCRF